MTVIKVVQLVMIIAIQSLIYPETVMQSTTIAEGRYEFEPIFNSNYYYQESGKKNKINVILCHGTGDLGAKIWNDLIPELEKKYHVYAFDLPGFARSDKKNELYSPENYARFIKWFIDKKVSGPIYLVGHSLGGAICLYYAGTYPDSLDRLILVDVAGILHRAALVKNIIDSQIEINMNPIEKQLFANPIDQLKYLTNSSIETIDNKFMSENMGMVLQSKYFRKKVLSGNPIKISNISLIYTDFSQVINNITVPTWMIWGAKDEIAPLRTSIILLKNISNSSMILMSGVGHNPMLEDKNKFNTNMLTILSDTRKKLNEKKKIIDYSILEGNRVVSGKNSGKIEGTFKTLKIINCNNIILNNITAQNIIIDNSKVTIENSLFKSKSIGVYVKNSILQMTGVDIIGSTALVTYNSNIDLAGCILKGENESIRSEYKSTFVFSVCQIENKNKKEYVHRIAKLYQGDHL
jgi:pimeloyl-ACP methyl ester carboxylesterase